jgi:AbrB family looped-hinge helix DNA binding protein
VGLGCHVNPIRTRLSKGGRIVIPAEMRRAMGIEVGQEVVLRLEDGELRVSTLAGAIRRAQDLVRRHVPPERSLVEELLAERRREAADE